MEAASTVVIKVKYGNVLRRFNALIVDDELGLSIDGLKEKIICLFSLPPGTDLMLTYIDEDDDVITLFDADDLRDMVKQGLDPLRITAQLISAKSSTQLNHSNGSSMPNRSPGVQQPLQDLHNKVSGVLKNAPAPLRGTLLKLSTDLTSKVSSSSAPCVTELANCFSKIALSYLDQLSESQATAKPSKGDIPENNLGQTKQKDIDMSNVNAALPKVQPNEREETSVKSNGNNKTGLINVTGGSMETSSSEEKLGDSSCISSEPVCSRVSNKKSCPSKLDSCFIQDVTIMDGTIVEPLTSFTKIWRMRNNGVVAWPQKTQLAWTGGDRLIDELSVELEIPAAGLPVGQDLDIAVDLFAPEFPGRYFSYWRMASPSGEKFGQRVWVLIQVVDASVEDSKCETVSGLRTNLPPASSSLVSTESRSVSVESIAENSKSEPNDSQKTPESVVNSKPNNFQDAISDSLVAANSGVKSGPSADTSVQCPVVPKLDPPPPPAPLASSQESSLKLPEKKADSDARSSTPSNGLFLSSLYIQVPPSPSPPCGITSSSSESTVELPRKEEVIVNGGPSSVPFVNPSVQCTIVPKLDPPPSPAPVPSSQESPLKLPEKKFDSDASSFVPSNGLFLSTLIIQAKTSPPLQVDKKLQ